MKKLGIVNLFYKDFPDTCFDTVRLLDIIQCIEEVIDITKPDFFLKGLKKIEKDLDEVEGLY